MIRIDKHPKAPKSLSRKRSWTEEDVVGQLRADQNGKCYLCERKLVTDFQVDHLKSRDNHPRLRFKWPNLFWCCSYCNRKKSSSFDNILDPSQDEIEELLRQSLDFPNAKAIFSATGTPTEESDATIALLERIFNGTNRIRTIREQQFYDYAVAHITSFQKMAISWLEDPCEEAKRAIIESLDRKSEFLGFKYWIIKSNERLSGAFGSFIRWHDR